MNKKMDKKMDGPKQEKPMKPMMDGPMMNKGQMDKMAPMKHREMGGHRSNKK